MTEVDGKKWRVGLGREPYRYPLVANVTTTEQRLMNHLATRCEQIALDAGRPLRHRIVSHVVGKWLRGCLKANMPGGFWELERIEERGGSR